MRKKIKRYEIIDVLGWLFVVIAIVGAVNYISAGNPEQLIWLCYFGLFFIGAGLLSRVPFFVLAQLNIMIVPLLLWTIDFFSIFLTGSPLIGIASYFFVEGPLLAKIITLQHLFTIPLGLWALYLLGIDKQGKEAWKLSFIEVSGAYLLALIFTNPEKNINCVFENCLNFVIPGPIYPVVWFVVAFSVILILNFVLIKLFNKK